MSREPADRNVCATSGKDAVERVPTSFIAAAPESRSSRRKEAHSISGKGRWSLLTSAATIALLPLLLLVLTPLLSSGQTSEAISREVSIFNSGLPSAATITTNVEAISREVSVFNSGLPSATTITTNVEAISRELSIFNYGVPPVAFSIGSTNALKDVPNQVPFTFQTILDLTNLSLTLQTDDSRLQILGVTSVSPEVISTTLGTVISNNHPIAFTLNPATIPTTNHVFAYLNFQGITNLESAIVPLTINNFAANRASGQFAPGATSDGQVILIVNQPILFVTNKPQFGITMYGVPGATYAVESTTNLAPADWHELERLLETGPFLVIPGLTNKASQQFYRTERVGP